MGERIVVGVDGSDNAKRALRWAAGHALRRGASLDVVSAWRSPAGSMTPMGMAYVPPPRAALQEDAERTLERTLEECRADVALDDLELRCIVDEREAASLLCEVAEDAELLVVGSRGLGGFKGLILGSVSARCANACPCPVAIVPADWDASEADRHGVVSVGVDGSANADAAVEWADKWAPEGAVLRIISAWTVPAPYDRTIPEIDEIRVEDAARAIADRSGALVMRHEVVVEPIRLDARVALAQEAAGADLIVIGARGHRGFARMLLGSVASSVVHHVEAPTVIVPAPHDS